MGSTAPNGIVGAAGVIIVSISAATAFAAGTGSLSHDDLFQGIGNYSEHYAATSNEQTVSETVAAADDVDFIKDALKVSTSDLAKYLGVSRQALYDWKSGKLMKAHNVSKLENLRRGAEVIFAANLNASAIMLNRKLPGGRTLLEAIAAGADGHDTAQSLVAMLKRESERRKELEERMGHLKPLRPSKFAGVTAITSERG